MAAPVSSVFLAIRDTFSRMSWHGQEVPGREVLEAMFDAHHGRVRVHAQAFAELNAVSVVGTLGHAVPQSRMGIVSELLMRTNHELTVGNFELDWDSGAVLFRATNVFPAEAVSTQIIASLVHTAVAEADRMTPFLTLVLRMPQEELARLNVKLFLMREDLLPPVPDAEDSP